MTPIVDCVNCIVFDILIGRSMPEYRYAFDLEFVKFNLLGKIMKHFFKSETCWNQQETMGFN